jgi:hypothetical protein
MVSRRSVTVATLCVVVPFLAAFLSSPTYARTWYILVDGTGAAPTIQAGIDSAAVGDTVLVGPGRYFEHIDFLGKRLVLQSTAGANATFLDGSQSPGSIITMTHWEPEGTVIQGFTITGGSADDGGGIQIGGSSPQILENVITGNHARFGGAIHIRTSNASYALIRSNRIENNSCYGSGGAVMAWRSGVAIIDNVFSENVTGIGDGAAIYLQLDTNRPNDREVVISGNVFSHNEAGDKGGAIFIYGMGLPGVSITGNLFALNVGGLREPNDYGTGGGIFATEARVGITRNTFYGNDATFKSPCGGGAVSLYNSPSAATEVRFNIIAENLGCGASCEYMEGGSSIGPNLFWQNTDADIGMGQRTCPQVWFDTAIIADPLFCDPENGDYRVAANSPALTDERGVFGAYPTAGCASVLVVKSTWGQIKARYR